MISGLAAAMLGQVGLLRMFISRHAAPEGTFASIFFFLVLCLGLRRMLAAGTASGYWGRVGSLLAKFTLPAAGLIALTDLVLNFRVLPRAFSLLVPSGVAALLVSFRAPRSDFPEPGHASWKAIGIGVVTTLLVAFGAAQGGKALNLAFERTRQAANRAAMASVPEIPSDLPYPKIFFQRGVTLTAEFPDVYASEGARRMLEALPQYGVNAVALVPYGFAPRDRPLVHLNIGTNSWESDEGVEELSRLAHAHGLKVLLKPGMWVGGGYAGDLKFPSDVERGKWFAEYRIFLEHYARLAKRIHADLFCVGGEFSNLSQYDVEWRKLIARARELYPGPLVYAANFGPEFRNLTFWDALDYIGLQEYYSLPDDLAVDPILEEVEAVQRKFQRPVIFTEAGFSSYAAPNRQPWDASGSKLAPGDQARCYEAVFRAFYSKPWFQGVYWWKVGTNGYGGPEDGSHTPWGKPAMSVIAKWYREGGR